uniref:Major facilitator superfamily (MFS) profile domain-containing protein n=1 Tax=Aureoumbra lagunensis TaxID=44058 RepID=A0A7S3K1N8_9STRA|mmetsp:Transcript_8765/g.12184  ORF Transcript_8765/g.12184 Transcript_8765/m.12184 type:complete len:532 (-) Transcript_8765:677-2272(-)
MMLRVVYVIFVWQKIVLGFQHSIVKHCRSVNIQRRVPITQNKLLVRIHATTYREIEEAETERESLIDDRLGRLGVNKYQALMAIFVAMVYAADGAEVTVMSLVARTLGEKWGLESWQRGLLGTSVYSGMFAGGLLCGPVADSKGRSFTLIAATALISIFGVLSAYAPSFNLLCLARFIAGIGMGASLPVSSSLLQETVPKKYKGGLACLVFAGFNLGELFAAKAGIYAFQRPDPSTWLFLVAAIPAILTWAVSLIVPESPRFMAAKGDKIGVERWFRRVAKMNNKDIDKDIFPPIRATSDQTISISSTVERMCTVTTLKQDTNDKNQNNILSTMTNKLRGLFRPGGLRLRTLVLWSLWMAANASFYGLIFSLPEALRHAKMSANDVAFDIAKGISRVSALQSFSFFCFMPLVFLNVRYNILFPFAFAGATISLLSAGVLATTTPSPAHLVTCLAFAKFFYNGVFMMLYPATGSAYPTNVRATGVALAGTVGRICTILVPPVCTKLQEMAALLPYQLFIVTSSIAFLSSLLL